MKLAVKNQRSFSSLQEALAYLRQEGFKPLADEPSTWKRVFDHSIEEAVILAPRSGFGKTRVTFRTPR